MNTRASTRECDTCHERTEPVMAALGVCSRCVLTNFHDCLPKIRDNHAVTRQIHDLAAEPPVSRDGVACSLCSRGCSMRPGERGYCNLREGATARSGGVRLRHLAGRPSHGLLQWYRDPLPTNCVADWVCAGHDRRGMHNLAVFYQGCTFNCLFCQNWHFRNVDPATAPGTSARRLAERSYPDTFCVCFFGGDPSSQMPHALESGRLLAERGIRVCWETNGSQNPRLMDRAVDLSLVSGGTIKIDVKAIDDRLHVALTGASNQRTLANVERVARRAGERRSPPLLVVSTLLVPGYVTPEEVSAIARFIASLDPEIPYSLLAFAPAFVATDLPRTSWSHAREAEHVALAAGLHNVRVGNRHLLDRN